MTIGKTLKQLMYKHGLNSLELSRRTGLGQPVIYRIMTDETLNPKMDTLCVLANYFGITVNQLIGTSDPLSCSEQQQGNNRIALLDWEQAANLDKVTFKSKAVIADTFLNSPGVYALKMYDDSMEPLFPKGAVLLVGSNKIPKDNSYVVVKVKGDDKAILRQIVFDENYKYLKPLNYNSNKYKVKLLSKRDKCCGVLMQARINFDY